MSDSILEFVQEKTVDLGGEPGLDYITAMQNDTASRFILLTIEANKKTFVIAEGTTAVLRAKKESGAKVFDDCTVNDTGKVVVPLTTQLLTEVGMVTCEVCLVGLDGSKLTTVPFLVKVIPSSYDDSEIESTDEYTALTVTLSEAAQAIENEAANTIARHTHTNKVTLNKFTEDANGGILFGGEPIKTSPIIVDTETELNELYPTPADGLDAIVREYENISDNPYAGQLTAEKLYINDNFKPTGTSFLIFYGTVGEYMGEFTIAATTDASQLMPSLIGIEMMVMTPGDDDSEAPLYFRFNEETFVEEFGLTFSKGWNKVSEDEVTGEDIVTPIEFSDIPVPEDCMVLYSEEAKYFIALSEFYWESKPFYSLDGKWNEYKFKAAKPTLYIKGRDNDNFHIKDTVWLINSMNMESGVYTSPTSIDMAKFWSWGLGDKNLYEIPPTTPLTIEGLTAAYKLVLTSLFPEAILYNITVSLKHDSETAFSGVAGDTNYFYVTYMDIVTGEKWTETGTREIMIVLGLGE